MNRISGWVTVALSRHGLFAHRASRSPSRREASTCVSGQGRDRDSVPLEWWIRRIADDPRDGREEALEY